MMRLYMYTKTIGYMILIILVSIFLITMFNYFNILGNVATTYLKLIIVIITSLIGGIMIGKSSNEKGWLEGLKLGLTLTILMMLFSYLGLDRSPSFKNIVYYIILIVTSILGGMIGISKKDPTNE